MSSHADLVSVKVWRPDGTLAWTNRAQQRIGHRFLSALTGDLVETIASKRAHASINKLGDDEDAAERALGLAHVFEIYAPIMSADGTRALGAYEIYAKPERAESFIASTKRVIWIAVIAVFAVPYAALAPLVRQGVLDDATPGDHAAWRRRLRRSGVAGARSSRLPW